MTEDRVVLKQVVLFLCFIGFLIFCDFMSTHEIEDFLYLLVVLYYTIWYIFGK